MLALSAKTLPSNGLPAVATRWLTGTEGADRYGPYPHNLAQIRAVDLHRDTIATDAEICTVLGIDPTDYAHWPPEARSLAQDLVDRAVWELARAGSAAALEADRSATRSTRRRRARTPRTGRLQRSTRNGSTTTAAHPIRRRLLLALALVLLLVLALVTGRALLQRTPASTPDTPSLTLGEPLDPGSLEQLWSQEVPEEAVVTGFDTGITVEDGATLGVLSPVTGQELTTVATDAPIEWITESETDGRPHLIWRTTGSPDLHLWSPDMDQPATITTGTELTVSDAGSGLLLTDPDGAAYRLQDRALDQLPVPEGRTAMAVDGQSLVSSAGDATATVSDTDGTTLDEITLATPELEDAVLDRWVSAGHGLAVTVWAHHGDQYALVIHSLADGTVRSTAPIDPDAEHRWIRGQGHDLAAWGPLVFSLTEGTLLADATDQGLVFARPKGTLGVLPRQDDTALVTTGTVARPLDPLLVAETDTVAVLQPDPGTLAAHRLPTP